MVATGVPVSSESATSGKLPKCYLICCSVVQIILLPNTSNPKLDLQTETIIDHRMIHLLWGIQNPENWKKTISKSPYAITEHWTGCWSRGPFSPLCSSPIALWRRCEYNFVCVCACNCSSRSILAPWLQIEKCFWWRFQEKSFVPHFQ